jgi:hypothetical protein
MVGFLFSGSPMHIDTTATSVRMQEGTEQIATLRNDANEGHIAEHIRGMVAATMGTLSLHASDTTRSDAEQWQQWALGVADGLALPVAV